PSSWPMCRQLLPHAQALLGRIAPEHPSPFVEYLLNRTAMFLMHAGDAAAALPLFQRAAAAAERVHGKDHSETFDSVSNLAACMEELGDAEGALPLYTRTLEAS